VSKEDRSAQAIKGKGDWVMTKRTKQNITFFLSALWVLSLAALLKAAAPGEINYQGKLTDSSGNPANGNFDMVFRIYDAATGGTPLVTDVRQGTDRISVSNGVFNAVIGGIPATLTFSSPITELRQALQGGADRWLAVTVNGTDLSPRQKLVAAPYALAVAAGSISNAEISSQANIDPAKISGGSFQSQAYIFPGSVGIGNAPDPTFGKLSLYEGQLGIRSPSYSANTFYANSRDIFSQGSEPLYINYSDNSGDVQIGGEGEIKVLNVAGDVAASREVRACGGGQCSHLRNSGDNNNYLRGATYFETNAFQRIMTVLPSNANPGAVGIGTSPQRRFHVRETSGVEGALFENSGSLALVAVGFTGGISGQGTNANSFGVQGWSNASNTTGVSGISNGTGGTGVQGNGVLHDFFASGPGGNFDAASSIRWKKNVRPFEGALAKVLNLRGVYFDWDQAHGGKQDMGMIAEDTGKVVPEVVTYEQDGINAIGMDYGKLTPVLVEAIKEQQKQIEALKKEIESLKNK
jgi:hypothetical protein